MMTDKQTEASSSIHGLELLAFARQLQSGVRACVCACVRACVASRARARV